MAAVIGIALLASRLSGDGSGAPALSTACPDGEPCPPATPAARPIADSEGSARRSAQGGPILVSEVAPPAINGVATTIIEEPCGALLYSYNAHQPLAPASLTKIATALVAIEREDPAAMVDVQVDGAELAATTDSTVMGLEPGQRLSLRDLLYGLLLPSGNDAAIAIAEHIGGSIPAFVEMMNAKMEELGLQDTHFTNPHGLDDPALYTSALDIAELGRELLRQPELAAIVRTRSYQPAWDGPILWNNNLLLVSYPGALGVKIGYTDQAQQTIVAAAERQGRRLIISVLGSSDMYRDAIALFDWAFTNTSPSCQ